MLLLLSMHSVWTLVAHRALSWVLEHTVNKPDKLPTHVELVARWWVETENEKKFYPVSEDSEYTRDK